MISLDRLIHWLKTSGAGQITRYLCISAASLLTLSSWSQEPPIPQTISVSDEEMATATPAQLEAWANEGQSKAQFSLGLAYYNGTVVEQDMEKAAQWFQLAAEAGHPNAQYNLGVLHVQGQGVDKDFRKAAKWFRAAADQGETTSQYNMGIFHLNGLGVPADPAESLRYFSLAAAQGDTRSQFQLGVAIARGEGIAQNFPEAYLWINLGCMCPLVWFSYWCIFVSSKLSFSSTELCNASFYCLVFDTFITLCNLIYNLSAAFF